MDLKVDGSSGTDVVFVATNAGLWRSLNGGATFNGVGLPNDGSFLAWSIAQVNGAWLASFEQLLVHHPESSRNARQ